MSVRSVIFEASSIPHLRYTLRIEVSARFARPLLTRRRPRPSSASTLCIQRCALACRRLLAAPTTIVAATAAVTATATAASSRAGDGRWSWDLVAGWVGAAFVVVDADCDSWVRGRVCAGETDGVGSRVCP